MRQKELAEELIAAREYENIHSKKILAEQKPVFHMSVPVGWMNDPNGFSMFQNKCHLFYQYHPYDVKWGPMYWGHAVTSDFIRWEPLPCVLAPEKDYDNDGCFSGTALEVGDKHVIMYTGVSKKEVDETRVIRQTQCIAIGDGTDYFKYEHNPVITADMLPEGSSKVDFRDPKIWKDEDGFWSLVGSKDETGSGQLALFHSENALEWTFVQMLDYCHHEYGEMWECPDFFAMGEEQILIVSPQFMEADGNEFQNGNHTIYFIGKYDKKTGRWTRDIPHMLDFGMDFYAAQTMEAEDGRRIMIAWLQNWDNYLNPEGYEWSGMMTIPRELEVRGDRIIQNPVRELANYYRNPVSYQDYELTGAQKDYEIPGISGRVLDLTVHIKRGEYSRFSIAVAANEAYRTVISFDRENASVRVNRAFSGLKRDCILKRSMRVSKKDGELKLRILMDRNSIEVFVNDGEQAMTTLIYTPAEAQQIFWNTDGSIILDIDKNDIVLD